MVEGTPTQVDLGVLPTLWSASGALFLGGCIVFGIATMRARVLSRAAAAVLRLRGFIASAPISIGLNSPRLTAVPIGIGLASLGLRALVTVTNAQPRRSAGHGHHEQPQPTTAA